MDDFEKTKKSALRLLAFRPRSENELRKRLGQKKLPAESIERVVGDLRKEGMLDDARFAKLYALSRIQSRSFGKGRVRRELTQRGLSGAQVAKAMEEIADVDEAELAEALVQKRLTAMRGISLDAKKRRLQGFLMRRGFGTDVIFKVLGRSLGPIEEME